MDYHQQFMLNLFTAPNNIYNLKNFSELYCEKRKITLYCTDAAPIKIAQLCDLLPCETETSPTSSEFKKRIKTWNSSN